MEFIEFRKISRLSRDIVITEKIDGTNGLIAISEDGKFQVGSRSRWITPGKSTDNSGFASWAYEHKDELLELGAGYHYGEWWGQGIQRGYGLSEKRFSLFNIHRWGDESARPKCCHVVPTLYMGMFDTNTINSVLLQLSEQGSVAASGFPRPEGIVIFHTASGHLYKKTIENDEKPKGIN